MLANDILGAKPAGIETHPIGFDQDPIESHDSSEDGSLLEHGLELGGGGDGLGGYLAFAFAGSNLMSDVPEIADDTIAAFR